MPSNSAILELARSDYRAAEENPRVRELAKAELRHARDALTEADRAWARNEGMDEIEIENRDMAAAIPDHAFALTMVS